MEERQRLEADRSCCTASEFKIRKLTFSERSNVNLLTSQVVIVNCARQDRARNSNGTSFAHNPVLTPALYNPRAPNGTRFTNLNPTTIGRLYHSLATLGPDGAMLIGGSAPYDCCPGCGPTCYESYGYTCTNTPNADCYPSECTTERFFPPYFYNRAVPQPVTSSAPAGIAYGQAFEVVFRVRSGLTAPAVRAAIVNPGVGEC